MAIKKKYLKSKPVCKVTFEFNAPEANEIFIAGDFNEWKEVPMKKYKNGKFKATVDVATPKNYEYKFLKDGEFVNDPEAEEY